MRRPLLLTLLIALGTLCLAQDDAVRTAFHVRYVGSGSVYIDGGRGAGLAEGMKLVIKGQSNADEAGVIASLKVVAIAETSAVCEVVSARRPLAVGDVATPEQDDLEKLVARRLLSNTRQYPAVVSFTEGDPLDEEVRDLVPRPPLPEVNRAVGRIGFDYSTIGSQGQRSSLAGLVLRTEITRIGGTYWNLGGYWRGTLDSRSSAAQPTLQQLLNRTYHLTLTYANPNSRWVAGFGRMYLPYAPSLETIDGGYFGRRLSKTATAGIFAGTTPDPTSWSYDPNRRLAGTFVNFDGGSFEHVKYTSTVGGGVMALRWTLDRPFAFLENTISYKNTFSLYSSLQVDRPRIDASLPPVGLGLGRSYLSIGWQPHPRLSFSVNHNYFRDVPTFDPQLVGTGLLDKYLFQGFSFGVRAGMPRHVTVYTSFGRSSSSHDARASWNTMLGASKSQIWRTGLTADVRYSRFNSAFAQGAYRSFSLSRMIGEGLRLELQAGTQRFRSSFTNDTGSRFVNATADFALRSHYFLEGGFTVQRGALQNYNQWRFGIGYRFDNRRVRKEAFDAKP